MHPRRSAALLALAAAAAATGCADAVSGISGSPAQAAAKAQQFSSALAARFTNPERSSRFGSARKKVAQGALVPSRIWGDTSVWTASIPGGHRLTAVGSLGGTGYRFDAPGDPRRIGRLGDSYHLITLRRLSSDEFRWETGVDYIQGTVRAQDVGRMVTGVLGAPHGRSETTLRAMGLAGFPRTAQAMGSLFTLDSMRTTAGANGTTLVQMVARMEPGRLRRTHPAFADYLAKYGNNARYRFLLTDRAGTPVFEFSMRDRVIRATYRLQHGALVTTTGTPRPAPDSMLLVTDATMKITLFDVGFHNLVTDFIVVRTPTERSWVMVAQREPDWKLPLVTERFLRTPLRRPFQGDGAMFRIGVVDSATGPAVLTRQLRLDVQESAILRFLGGLSSRVFEDLDEKVEREESAWLSALFTAFGRDAAALIGGATEPR
jgi:hypothetical protein